MGRGRLAGGAIFLSQGAGSQDRVKWAALTLRNDVINVMIPARETRKDQILQELHRICWEMSPKVGVMPRRVPCGTRCVRFAHALLILCVCWCSHCAPHHPQAIKDLRLLIPPFPMQHPANQIQDVLWAIEILSHSLASVDLTRTERADDIIALMPMALTSFIANQLALEELMGSCPLNQMSGRGGHQQMMPEYEAVAACLDIAITLVVRQFRETLPTFSFPPVSGAACWRVTHRVLWWPQMVCALPTISHACMFVPRSVLCRSTPSGWTGTSQTCRSQGTECDLRGVPVCSIGGVVVDGCEFGRVMRLEGPGVGGEEDRGGCCGFALCAPLRYGDNGGWSA